MQVRVRVRVKACARVNEPIGHLIVAVAQCCKLQAKEKEKEATRRMCNEAYRRVCEGHSYTGGERVRRALLAEAEAAAAAARYPSAVLAAVGSSSGLC